MCSRIACWWSGRYARRKDKALAILLFVWRERDHDMTSLVDLKLGGDGFAIGAIGAKKGTPHERRIGCYSITLIAVAEGPLGG